MAESHAEHHGPSYMAIFWYLAVLTVVEIAVIFLPIGKLAIGVLLVSMASAKAALVALYFMHLRFETKTLGYIALTPVLIGALLVLVLLPDSLHTPHQTARHEEGRGAEALRRVVSPRSAGPVTLTVLPTVNAVLNASAAVAMVAGFVAIRRGRVAVHRACMLTAVGLSVLFLGSYLTYHAQVGSRPYGGAGWIRTVYFTILLTHTVLAIVIVPLVGTTLYRALRAQFGRHARLARVTLPLWLYVSVTGVVVYWMLYHG